MGVSPQDWEIIESLWPLAVLTMVASFLLGNYVLTLLRRAPLLAFGRRAQVALAVAVVLGLLAGLAYFHHVPSEHLALADSCSVYATPRAPSPPLRVKIITVADGRASALGDISARLNGLYAKRHGFGFERHHDCAPARRALQWAKIALLHAELSRPDAADWLVWIDADAVFVDLSYDLFARYLAALPDAVVLVVAQDIDPVSMPINTGFMAVRRGRTGRRLLERIWAWGPRLHLRHRWFHEQGTLTHLVHVDAAVARQVRVLVGDDEPRVKMYTDGSLVSGVYPREPFAWRPGALVAHAIGPKPGGTDKMAALRELEQLVMSQV